MRPVPRRTRVEKVNATDADKIKTAADWLRKRDEEGNGDAPSLAVSLALAELQQTWDRSLAQTLTKLDEVAAKVRRILDGGNK